MRSVLTLDGVAAPSTKKPRKKRVRKPRQPPPPVGTCKSIHNPRTKKTLQLCYVGSTWKNEKVPTGWRLMSAADQAELKRKTRD